MVNNLHSWQILLTSSFGFFLGAFLSLTVNAIARELTEQVRFNYVWSKSAFLASIAMGVFGGCCTLAIGSVDVGYLESTPLPLIFIYPFSLSLFSGASDSWIKIVKLIFSKVSTSNNRD